MTIRFGAFVVVVSVLVSLCSGRIYFPKGHPFHHTRPAPPDPCDYAVDVAQALDVSYSQFDNMAAIKSTLMDAVNHMEESLPESRFSLSIFTDKPIPPLGFNRDSWRDFCLLSRTTFEDTAAALEHRLSLLNAGGGFDFPEAQLEALIRVATSPMFQWRDGPFTPEGRSYVPAVLLVTDSIPHFPNAAQNAVSVWNANSDNAPLPVPSDNLLLDDPSIVATDLNNECGTMEYPEVEDVGTALKDKKILPIFLLAPAAFRCGDRLCPYPELRRMAQETGNPDFLDPMTGMILVYEKLLDDMGTVGVIQELGLGFQGFREKFEAALEEVGFIPDTCNFATTTTTVSTTTTATLTPVVDTPPSSSTTTPTTTTTTTTTTTSATSTPPACDCCDECDCDCEPRVRVNVEIDVSIENSPSASAV